MGYYQIVDSDFTAKIGTYYSSSKIIIEYLDRGKRVAQNLFLYYISVYSKQIPTYAAVDLGILQRCNYTTKAKIYEEKYYPCIIRKLDSHKKKIK